MLDCVFCGKALTESLKRRRAKYCSITCSKAQDRFIYRENNPPLNVSPGTVGTISELVVAVDLLEKGYEVFRAMSPDATCDIAILSGGKLYRVEVRTAYYNRSGNLSSNLYKKDAGRFDILAQRIRSGGIKYTPPLEELAK